MGSISSLPTINTQNLLYGSNMSLNVQQLVQASMQALELPASNLLTQQSVLNTESGTLTGINSDLNALQTAFQSLTSLAGGLSGMTATSANSAVVTATAGDTAVAGNHAITISALATTSSYDTNDLASPTTTFGTGTVQIQVGSGTAQPITVSSGNNTLTGLAAAINQAGIGVTASVITDANGARLALLSDTTGTPGNLTVTSNVSGLTFTQTQPGTNAALTVDGISLSESSNTVTGAIPGVTLSLMGTSSTPVGVQVGADATTAAQAIQSFVSAYNTVIQDANHQFAVSTGTDAAGNPTVTAQPLQADAGLMQVQNQLLDAANYAMSGNNGITSLASLGITMNSDGTLAVSNATLQNALSSNFSAVQNFFQGVTATFGANLGTVLGQLTAPGTGPLTVEINNIGTQQNDLTSQINQINAQLAVRQQLLTQQYSQLNATLQTLPLLLQQINGQLGSLSGNTSTGSGGGGQG